MPKIALSKLYVKQSLILFTILLLQQPYVSGRSIFSATLIDTGEYSVCNERPNLGSICIGACNYNIVNKLDSGYILCQKTDAVCLDIVICDGSMDTPHICYEYTAPALARCAGAYRVDDSTVYMRLVDDVCVSLNYLVPVNSGYEYTNY